MTTPPIRAPRMLRCLTFFGTAVLSVGCVTSSNQFLPEGVERGGANEILSSEIRAVEASHPSAREVIRDLRPAWLRVRSAQSFSGADQPIVFLDGVRFGLLNDLYRIDSSDIQRMEYISGLDATTLYGTGYGGGAIQIYTRSSNRPG